MGSLSIRTAASSLMLSALALTATPAAAFGISSGTSLDSVLRVNARHLSVSTDSSTSVDSHLFLKRSGDADAKAKAKAEVSVDARRSKETTIVGTKARIEKMLSRVFGFVARTAKHVCSKENDSSTGVRDCMADMKSHVQARVSTMIEVAFAI